MDDGLPNQPQHVRGVPPEVQGAVSNSDGRGQAHKGLSNHIQVNHTVTLSTTGEYNYHFGVMYAGNKQLSPTEAFPVLVVT